MSSCLPASVSWLTFLLHVLAVLTSLSMAVAFFDKTLFSYHPTLMALGFLLFHAESIISAVHFRGLVRWRYASPSTKVPAAGHHPYQSLEWPRVWPFGPGEWTWPEGASPPAQCC